METLKSIFNGSSACKRARGGLSEWFEIEVGLCLGCVMSPWLLKVFMDGALHEVSDVG